MSSSSEGRASAIETGSGPPSVSALWRRRNWPAFRSGAGGTSATAASIACWRSGIGGDEAPRRRARDCRGCGCSPPSAPRSRSAGATCPPRRRASPRAWRTSRPPFRAPRRRNPPSRSGSRASRCAHRRCATGPRIISQHVVVVDRVRGEAAAELGRPAPAPGIGIVGRKPPPMRLDRRGIGFADEALARRCRSCAMPFGEAVLEDRRDALAGLPLQLGERVGLGERARERLFDARRGGRREAPCAPARNAAPRACRCRRCRDRASAARRNP